MEVSAELTVAFEAYENHLVNQTADRIGIIGYAMYDELMEHLETVPREKWKGIKQIIARNIVEAAKEANTAASIHERALGLTSETAPAEIVKKSIGNVQESLRYWSDV